MSNNCQIKSFILFFYWLAWQRDACDGDHECKRWALMREIGDIHRYTAPSGHTGNMEECLLPNIQADSMLHELSVAFWVTAMVAIGISRNNAVHQAIRKSSTRLYICRVIWLCMRHSRDVDDRPEFYNRRLSPEELCQTINFKMKSTNLHWLTFRFTAL